MRDAQPHTAHRAHIASMTLPKVSQLLQASLLQPPPQTLAYPYKCANSWDHPDVHRESENEVRSKPDTMTGMCRPVGPQKGSSKRKRDSSRQGHHSTARMPKQQARGRERHRRKGFNQLLRADRQTKHAGAVLSSRIASPSPRPPGPLPGSGHLALFRRYAARGREYHPGGIGRPCGGDIAINQVTLATQRPRPPHLRHHRGSSGESLSQCTPFGIVVGSLKKARMLRRRRGVCTIWPAPCQIGLASTLPCGWAPDL